jgi:cupin fold WbuC family metalloprotein
VLRDRVVEVYYDDSGVLVESFVLGDCHVAGAPRNDVPMVYALNIPASQWHTLRALDPGTVILEMKDGPYEPIQECDILK